MSLGIARISLWTFEAKSDVRKLSTTMWGNGFVSILDLIEEKSYTARIGEIKSGDQTVAHMRSTHDTEFLFADKSE